MHKNKKEYASYKALVYRSQACPIHHVVTVSRKRRKRFESGEEENVSEQCPGEGV